MSKTILEIYKDYKIPSGLAMHMFRVAAVASMICDNFTKSINKEEIVTACLLHDMGNIVKVDFSRFPEFFEPEGVPFWQGVQTEFIEKYGNNDHEANNKIAEEIGVSIKIRTLIDELNFSLMCQSRDRDDFTSKIMNYVDQRVAPLGVVSYDERMEEARIRYAHLNSGREEERNMLVECGKEIEKQIFAKCKIKPEDINDETVEPIIAELKNFVIK